MSKVEEDPASILNALKADMRSVLLSTLGENGDPHSGYTPFIFDTDADTEHHIIIFVSRLALHTRDLLSTGKVSAMLIRDESESQQIYARRRVRYQCQAEVIPNDHERYGPLLDAMGDTHGKMVSLIRTLPDFVLFRLKPTDGQFVMGFGQAFKLNGTKFDQLEHTRRA
ncbi:pyridoxamine 5'-phosphate oxidase family protein [Granulosicoccus sp.]|nr:pyridoxamine 5'-phosphate oxidase family protein [Granulosicoccus sp.]MDB4222274.1 pyridoxamine 5'-phosphate oxidase family protein [Granulosicoccus sp.]